MSTQHLKEFLSNALEIGTKATRTKMLERDQYSSQIFFDDLALLRQHSRNDTLGDIDGLLNAIDIANTGFKASPRKMLIIQMSEYRADLLLVSPPTNDGRKVV
jgi:hypothetical protein